MQLNEKNYLKYFTFDSFTNEGVKHAFSTRYGGVSTEEYKSLNLSFRNDNKKNVIINFERFCNAVNLNHKNTVFSNQIHKDKIYIADKKDRGKGLFIESDIKGIDALITNEKDVILTTFYADCVPIFIYDKKQKVIAMAHSGWQGSLKNISVKTILKMKEEFNCNMNDILVGIGPSIHKCCFETSEDVSEKFIKEMPFSKKFIYKEIENDKFKIDLQSIIKQNLLNLNILDKNIEISNMCTKCNPNLFFSHRAMGGKRGSLAGIISL